jgi:hypothetical protein
MRRFRAGVVLLFAGATQARSPFNLTMNSNDAIETAHAFPNAMIVPVHGEGWAHSPKAATISCRRSLRLACNPDCKCLSPVSQRRSTFRRELATGALAR